MYSAFQGKANFTVRSEEDARWFTLHNKKETSWIVIGCSYMLILSNLSSWQITKQTRFKDGNTGEKKILTPATHWQLVYLACVQSRKLLKFHLNTLTASNFLTDNLIDPNNNESSPDFWQSQGWNSPYCVGTVHSCLLYEFRGSSR